MLSTGSWERCSDRALELTEGVLKVRCGLQRAKAGVARSLQCLEERRNARLTETIRVFSHLFDLQRLRQNLRLITQIGGALRIGQRRGRHHLSGDARKHRVPLRVELSERGFFENDPGTM